MRRCGLVTDLSERLVVLAEYDRSPDMHGLAFGYCAYGAC